MRLDYQECFSKRSDPLAFFPVFLISFLSFFESDAFIALPLSQKTLKFLLEVHLCVIAQLTVIKNVLLFAVIFHFAEKR